MQSSIECLNKIKWGREYKVILPLSINFLFVFEMQIKKKSLRGDPHRDFNFSVLCNYKDISFPLEIVHVDMNTIDYEGLLCETQSVEEKGCQSSQTPCEISTSASDAKKYYLSIFNSEV